MRQDAIAITEINDQNHQKLKMGWEAATMIEII